MVPMNLAWGLVTNSADHKARRRFDLLRLHAIILVWGFTAVIGRLIDLPAIEIVFFRCSIAAATLAMWFFAARHFGKQVPKLADELPLASENAALRQSSDQPHYEIVSDQRDDGISIDAPTSERPTLPNDVLQRQAVGVPSDFDEIRDAVQTRHRMPMTWAILVQWWLIGALIAIHWILFFAAVKVGSVSVAMIGLATMSLWTALLEPLMVRGRRYRMDQFLLAAVIVAAVAFIFADQTASSSLGFALAIAAAMLAAVFSILNVRYTLQFDPKRITMHQMTGAAVAAAVLCTIAWWTPSPWLIEPTRSLQIPDVSDSISLVLLAVVCTVYAYVEFVELLSRLSVYSIIFANNLEPMYGIALGSLLFGEHKQLTPRFFIGGGIIVAAVMLQTFLAANRRRAINRLACEPSLVSSN